MSENKEVTVSMDQLRKMFTYLMDEKKEGSFRYIIYDVMGFECKDYCDLYSTGLMEFKDWISDLKKIKKEK